MNSANVGEDVTMPCSSLAKELGDTTVLMTVDLAHEVGLLRSVLAAVQRSQEALQEEVATERAARVQFEGAVSAALRDVISSVNAVSAKTPLSDIGSPWNCSTTSTDDKLSRS